MRILDFLWIHSDKAIQTPFGDTETAQKERFRFFADTPLPNVAFSALVFVDQEHAHSSDTETTLVGSVSGTLAYMSPEQACGVVDLVEDPAEGSLTRSSTENALLDDSSILSLDKNQIIAKSQNLISIGKCEAAEKMLVDAEWITQDTGVRTHLGEFGRARGKFNQSEAVLKKARQEDPNAIYVMRSLASTLVCRDRENEAL